MLLSSKEASPRLTSANIATIINFCSNDYPFLKHCIDKVRPFSSQIIIPVCTHFFDQVLEDEHLLKRIYTEYPDVQFVQFPFDPNRSAYAYYGNAYWHNLGRLVGAYYVDKACEYILFLDADEIVETDRFLSWLATSAYHAYTAIRFATYWYFREASFRALGWEDMPLFMHKKWINGQTIMQPLQRSGMYDNAPFKNVRMLTGIDQKPLFHHYSFVRTKEQMLRKVLSWGHNQDRDWVADVEKEFAAPFTGRDFVRGYFFQSVCPYVAIDLRASPPNKVGSCDHVEFLTASDIYKIEIALTFDL